MLRSLLSIFLLLATALHCAAQEVSPNVAPLDAAGVDAVESPDDTLTTDVVLETTLGRITLHLYRDTPAHRRNFIRLVKKGFYDGLLFHRVIPGFVVQGGDSLSRNAEPGTLLGNSPEPYTIPAEIHFPQHFHKCGALAAARESDDVNPGRASSAYQFYIVNGRLHDDESLQQAQQYLDEQTGGKVRLTPEVKEVYRSFGGVPSLDGLYTVFGEVTSGLDVADRIQWVERDANNRPLNDVRILRAKLVGEAAREALQEADEQ